PPRAFAGGGPRLRRAFRLEPGRGRVPRALRGGRGARALGPRPIAFDRPVRLVENRRDPARLARGGRVRTLALVHDRGGIELSMRASSVVAILEDLTWKASARCWRSSKRRAAKEHERPSRATA